MIDRNKLRKDFIVLREAMRPEERDFANSAISEKLAGLDVIRNAKVIAAYMAFKNEVSLEAFFVECAEKKLCFPRKAAGSAVVGQNNCAGYELAGVPGSVFSREEERGKFFVPGLYGIEEPVRECAAVPRIEPEVWLVPGVAFDISGGRLGWGGGVYDRMLSGISAVTIGIGYDLQLQERVPLEPHDQLMDFIVTEKRVIKVAR